MLMPAHVIMVWWELYLIAPAQLYNRHQPLTAWTFWKTGILLGILHAAIVFFVVFFSTRKNGASCSCFYGSCPASSMQVSSYSCVYLHAGGLRCSMPVHRDQTFIGYRRTSSVRVDVHQVSGMSCLGVH